MVMVQVIMRRLVSYAMVDQYTRSLQLLKDTYTIWLGGGQLHLLLVQEGFILMVQLVQHPREHGMENYFHATVSAHQIV